MQGSFPAFCVYAAGILVLAGVGARPATAEIRGLPYSRVYVLEDIGYIPRGSHLNFDPFGRVAVVHDGVYAVLNDTVWLNLADTNRGTRVPITDVVQGRDGRTYYGGRATWGRAEFRSDGRLQAIPLVPEDPPAWTQSTTFEDVIVTRDGVYFASRSGVAFWDPVRQKRQLFEVPKASKAFRVGDQVFVSAFDHPLQYLDVARGTVDTVPGTPFDGRQDNVIERATMLDDTHALVSVLDGRLLVFDGVHATPWPGQRHADFPGRVAALQRLADGNIAIALTGRGVYIISPDGTLRSSLTIPQYHRVSDIASREPGVMWLMNEDSIEKVLYDSGLTSFGERLGLPLEWPLVVNWNDRIFVASGGVLYRAASSGPGVTAHFERLPVQPPNGAWALAAWGPHMLVGNVSGIYAAEPDGSFVPVGSNLTHISHLVMTGEGRCFAIGQSAIALLEWRGGRWTEAAARIPGVANPAVVHRAVDSVWIETGAAGVARVSCAEGKLHLMMFQNEPWTKSLWANVGVVGDIVVLSGSRGDRRFFSEKTGNWCEMPALHRLLDRSPEWLMRVRNDADGILWGTHNEGLVKFIPTEDGYAMDSSTFDLINDRYPVVRVLPDNEVWVSASRSLYHVEPDARTSILSPGKPVLVSLMDARRNVELLASHAEPSAPLQFPYAQNSLTFRFFSGSDAWRRTPTYEFRLDPTESWSVLDTGSLLRFPGLHEGTYRLQVRITSQLGAAGPPLTFPFQIHPPWQRTWPAYGLYASCALLAVVGTIRWSGHLARKRNRALELTVHERTGALEATMQKLNEETRITATLAERDRLAGEIHDSVQQGLSGAMLQLDTTLKLPVVTGDLRGRLNVVRNMVSYARQEVQHAVWGLDSPLLEGNDLGEALHKLTTFVASSPPAPSVVITGSPIHLPRSTTHHLLRIAQEATTNALRHSGAREIEIRLDYQPDAVSLDIADDGIGFHPQSVLNQAGHFGLRGIRAREKKLRGQLTITSSPGEGTSIRVVVPLQPEIPPSPHAEASRPQQNPNPACR